MKNEVKTERHGLKRGIIAGIIPLIFLLLGSYWWWYRVFADFPHIISNLDLVTIGDFFLEVTLPLFIFAALCAVFGYSVALKKNWLVVVSSLPILMLFFAEGLSCQMMSWF